MRFKSTLICIGFYLLPMVIYGQSFEWVGGFATQPVSSYGIQDRIIKLDKDKNTYLFGNFLGTIDFDPGPAVSNITATSGMNGFLLKLDSLGHFVWVKAFSGTGTIEPMVMEIDSMNQIYLGGRYSGTVDFDLGAGVYNQTSSNSHFFLSKLDSNTNLIWAKDFNTFNGNSSISGLKVDQTGQILMAGSFSNFIDFDPGPAQVLDTASGFNIWSGFCLKLSDSGSYVWHISVGTYGSDVDVDANGNFYFTGAFSGTCDFDPGAAVYNLSENGSFNDVFIAKYSANGSLVWAKSLVGNGTADHPSAIRCNQSHVVISGAYASTTPNPVDFNVGSGTYNMPTNGHTNGFILKLSNAGSFVWARQIYSNQSIDISDLAMDKNGDVYGIGTYRDSIIFNYLRPDDTFSVSVPFLPNLYVFKMSDSSFEWMRFYNNPGASFESNNIELDDDNGVYMAGYVQGNQVDFNLGTNINTVHAPNFPYTYILKLGVCSNSMQTLNISVCDSFSIGNQTFSNSGNYALNLPTANGCDSMVMLNLTIAQWSNAIQQSGNYLSCMIPYAISYQWIDCNTNLAIPNANGQTYSPTSYGNYACVVALNNCTDTSNCVSFIPAMLTDTQTEKFQVYPNPANDKVIFNPPSSTGKWSLRILQITGEVVYQEEFSERPVNYTIECSQFSSGTYFYIIEEENASSHKGRIMIQH